MGGELPTNLIPSHPGVTRGGVSLATLLFRLGADCPPAGPRRGTGGPMPTPPGHASRSPRHFTLTPASLGQAGHGSHEAEGGSGCGWGRARALSLSWPRGPTSAPRLEMERAQEDSPASLGGEPHVLAKEPGLVRKHGEGDVFKDFSERTSVIAGATAGMAPPRTR